MKTFEFTDEQRHELIEIFVHGTIQELLSRIEQIVSERITPEQCDGWVSDEDIDKEFPSTYAELSHRIKPTERLNAEYLEENGIDFFENFAKKEGAKWMRNKLSCNANKS